jgi:two-component system sensor histidine kinase and response regulator WspE
VSSDLAGYSMMELFRMEAESQTAALSAGLVSLEGRRTDPKVLEALMRAAHSLKGAARIVGLDAAVRVAHSLEDCFVAAQQGKRTLSPEDVDVLLRGVDMLMQVAQLGEAEVQAWQVKQAALIDAVVAELLAIKEGRPPLEGEPRRCTVSVSEPEPPMVASSVAGESSGNVGQVDLDQPGDGAAARPVVASSPRVPGGENHGKQEVVGGVARADGDRDGVVRVTAGSLTRLMGLAGEALVQAHRLPPLVDSLWRLKGQQTRVLESLEVLEDRVSSQASALPAASRELLANAKAQAFQDLQRLGEVVESLEEFARASEGLSSRLHHEVLTSRMRPMSDGVRAFPRLVRDLARGLGKQARFEVAGAATGVDRDILDRLEAPLNHLIRNALDHGIELPDVRRAAGKSAVGRILLEARHRAGMIQISVSDDGCGIELERLRAKVLERGLTSPAVAARLSESELLDFLFLPGFSTREHVTEVSGRGVGLDVVQSMVHAVRGSVRVSSRPGKGTRFVLQLPITVSVIRALLVEIADEPYAFPLNRIDRILMLDRKDVHELEGKQHVIVDQQLVGLVEGARVLDLAVDHMRRSSEAMPVVLASDRSHRFGVVVDRFLGERDLRVWPLDARLGKVPNIDSTSVLENGSLVLIVDVEDLIRSVDNLIAGRQLGKLVAESLEVPIRGHKRVLVVDDSITVRELERQLLESSGYIVDVAIDGIDGWNAIRSAHYDLVVSDVDMPRMDGIQLVRQIKQDARLNAIPVVIVSYKDREADRIRGLDAGANAYLTKSSFHDETFLTTVADLIGVG